MDRIFYRKGTICKGGFINEQVIGYNVFIQFSGGSLEDRIYDLLYNPSHISAEFKLEEAADYFIKNLELEFDVVQK